MKYHSAEAAFSTPPPPDNLIPLAEDSAKSRMDQGFKKALFCTI